MTEQPERLVPARIRQFLDVHVRSMRLSSAVVIVVLGWLIMCFPWFIGKRVIPWDSKDEFYPTLYYVSETLRSGDLPFWNPYVFSGHPLVSDPQAMLFSPLAVGLMTAVDKPSPYWFDAVELLHLLMGGLGTLFFIVKLGRSPLAGLFGAAVYMFGGPAAARLQHVPIVLAYGYFPFALLALEQALQSRRLRWGFCFGVVAGIMAAHQVQVAYLLSIVLAGYVLHEMVSSGSPLTFLKERWRVLAAGACSAVVTAGIPLFATAELLPMSTRGVFQLSEAVGNSMHPSVLLTYVVRDFFDNARLETFWGPGDVVETFLYAGMLPMVLFLVYGLASGAVFERHLRFFAAVGVCGALFALGRFTPFYGFAYHFIPGVNLFQRPPDGAFVLNMGLAMVTGLLMDRLMSPTPPRVRPWLLAATVIAGSVLVVWGIRFAIAAGKLSTMGKDLVLAVVLAAFTLWLLRSIAARPAAAKHSLLCTAAIVLLAVDLSVHNLGTQFNAHSPDWVRDYRATFNPENVLVKLLNTGLNPEDGSGPYRAEIVSAGSLWANSPMVIGVQSTQGYDPLRYVLYERAFGVQPIFNLPRVFTRMTPSFNSPLFNLLGVKYIATTRPLAEMDARVDESRFRLVYDLGIQVWENPQALPRVTAAASVYLDPDPDKAIDRGKMPELDYRSAVVLSRIPPTLVGLKAESGRLAPLPGTGDATARVVSYRSSEVVVEARSARDTIVVLNDLYYPYWRVYVDDVEQQLLQANYLFRGVHVGRGNHRVVFRFEPFSWPAFRKVMLAD